MLIMRKNNFSINVVTVFSAYELSKIGPITRNNVRKFGFFFISISLTPH